jgi:hypothetical protein
MSHTKSAKRGALGLHVGSLVEVLSPEEILCTLDDRGCLDGLPFMPEMLEYCGQRFRVYKSAHKTCDTIEKPVSRHMANAVHLEGIRCDGAAHGGCQAGCLLFWKKAWLRPIRREKSKTNNGPAPKDLDGGVTATHSGIDALHRATRTEAATPDPTEERYACQATELLRATTPLLWWDPRHYLRDLLSGNVGLGDFVRYVAIAAYNVVMRLHWRGRPYPYIRGLAQARTPNAVLNLQAGELVQVRAKDEIMQTINAVQKNRGLWFDVEMLRFCGKTFRVLRRVERIINDKTGAMIRMPNGCLILDGATCSGCVSRDRLFCPRSIYPYWHEVWLKRPDQQS